MTSFEVLCCRPEFFEVILGDNGYQPEGYEKWRRNPGRWRARLLNTWDAVSAELARRGGRLIQIQPDPDLPDQCFTADPVVVANHGNARNILLSHMNSPKRQREVDHVLPAYEKLGWWAHKVSDETKHEGTGDFLYLPGHDFFIQGYGPRSEGGSGNALSHLVRQLVVEVPLRIEGKQDLKGLASRETKSFHLDTLIFPLPDKRVIACFDRMHPATRALFKQLYPEANRIALTPKEADLFVANGLVVPALSEDNSKNGWTLFLPDKTPRRILKQISQWGFGYKLFDVEPATLNGGGLHCMFNIAFNIRRGRIPIAITQYGKPEGLDFLPIYPAKATEPDRPIHGQRDLRYYSPQSVHVLDCAA